MYTHSHAHTVGLTHWGPQWSPWRSTHSWGKSLYETQSPGRWFLCLPQNRTSLWSRALSSPVSTKQERNYKFTLSWQRAAANESVVRFQTVLYFDLRDYEVWLCLWIMCSSPVFWTWVFCPLQEGAAPKPTRYSWRWWWRGSCTQMEWKAKVKEQLAQIMSTVCFSLCSIKLWDEIAYVVPSWCSKNTKMD